MPTDEYIFDWKKSSKFQEQADKLPDHLKPIYDEIVSDYSTETIRKLGRAYVAYEILAEMVKLGWQKEA